MLILSRLIISWLLLSKDELKECSRQWTRISVENTAANRRADLQPEISPVSE